MFAIDRRPPRLCVLRGTVVLSVNEVCAISAGT